MQRLQSIYMRAVLIIIFSLFQIVAIGQKIEYRSDSLFVNNIFVDAATNRSVIDSLLASNSDRKSSNDEYRFNHVTGKSVVQSTDYYYKLGIFFRRYDFDTKALTVGIRMLNGNSPKAEANTGLIENYRGELFILENHMNEIKKPRQLTSLKNCEVVYRYLSTSSRDYLMQAEILHSSDKITIFFDEDTSEVISIFINLKIK